MPSIEERRNKIMLHGLFECDEFSIDGVLFGSKLHLHARWPGKHMTPSLYKKALGAILRIKQEGAQHGVSAIYCLVPASLTKWETMLGFEPIEEWTNTADPNENLFLMRQDVA